MKLCWNAIVKNESGRIERAMKSIVPYIESYVVVDTGSTDDTIQKIEDFMASYHILGKVEQHPFRDWSQARNAALSAARTARERLGWDYALLMDADMELVMNDLSAFHKILGASGPSYDMEQRAGTLHYMNRRLVHRAATGWYRGVTHEYLDIPTAGALPNTVAYFRDHADGANRPEKFKRDIRLLLEGLKKEPNNSRYYYYLAQSYRDADDLDNAMYWYKKRVEAGGWVEEQWSAQLNYAHCFKAKGDEANFIREVLVAYNMRPSRAEALYDLATYFRQQDGKQAIAALFAEVGMDIPRSTDGLFVNDYVYDSGLKEEFAITGYYNSQKREKAFGVASKLSLQAGPYAQGRETARRNLYWYIPKLKELSPSFEAKPIVFTPPAGWTAMNPSITLHKGELWCNVRCVNYRIDDNGRYLIRATDGTANATNPINTRNFLAYLGNDPLDTPKSVAEIMAPPDLPCAFPLVIGFEDMRLFSYDGAMWTSSTVRQVHPDGNCEQVLARIADNSVPDPLSYGLENVTRMLRTPRQTEKNWAPIPDQDQMLWMWRPGVTINSKAEFVHQHEPKITWDILSGGSQLVPMGPGYVALVHTAAMIPGTWRRYYYHRFVFYDAEFRLHAMSPPFVFNDKVIEFAAGMCRHPTDPKKLVLSYGFKDAEPWVGVIDEADIVRMIWMPRTPK